jgi:hypothetical protein
MTILSALPVQHLLLLGPDLSGAFRLYLPAVGLAIVWSRLFDRIPRWPRSLLASLLVLLNVAILEHNLAAWNDTTNLAKTVCISFGRSLAGTADTVWVEGLPSRRMGVVFLANGFPQCVAMNSGVPAGRIQIARYGQQRPAEARVFSWNDSNSRMERR